MLRPGDRVGDWIVDAPLGEGGMGAVYRAHSAHTERVAAALKVLKETGDPGERPRFVREAEALAALRHPAIVRVLGVTEDRERGYLCLAMEFAEGPTLRARLDHGPMDTAEAFAVFAPLAGALAHAHERGVAHQDVKPANVVLARDGPRLVDFGVAVPLDRETLASGERHGTPAYLPPEVFLGAPVSPPAADVYAFCLVLHEALVGARVFPVQGPLDEVAARVAEAKRRQGPLDPGPRFPPVLRSVVREGTDSDPSRRPAMAEVRDRLFSAVERRNRAEAAGTRSAVAATHALGPGGADEPTTLVPDPPTPLAPRRRGRLAAAAAGVALVAGVGAWLSGGRGDDPAPVRWRPPAERRAARPEPPSPAPPVVPTPEPSPEPSPEPGPEATPVPTSRPTPAETPRGDSAPAADDVDLTGGWTMENVVDETNVAAYEGLRLAYRLTLRQVGSRVVGEGRKVGEDGGPAAGTPIVVRGWISDGVVEANFTERGGSRVSRGRFRWRLDPATGTLSGEFESDAARSSGRSTLRRARDGS